jgi:hypothetical protein
MSQAEPLVQNNPPLLRKSTEKTAIVQHLSGKYQLSGRVFSAEKLAVLQISLI